MKSSFCIDLQRFMLIPTKFPLSRKAPLYSPQGGKPQLAGKLKMEDWGSEERGLKILT